jgi:hypothetical protein
MFKKLFALSFCFAITSLPAEGLENKAVVNESSCENQSLEYGDLQAKINDLVNKAVETKDPSELKKVIAHTIILASSLGLTVGTQHCLERFTPVNARGKSTPVFMISYILMRFFYEKLSNKQVDIENLAKFIKDKSEHISGLGENAKSLMINELENGLNQIKNKKHSEKVISGFVNHWFPILPAFALADSTALYLSGAKKTSDDYVDMQSVEDDAKAWHANGVYSGYFTLLYYLALIGLFNYVLAPKDESVDLIKQIEASINEMKLDQAKVNTCQA